MQQLIRSYTAIIDGNKDKMDELQEMFNILDNVSKFVFDLGRPEWSDQKSLYKKSRENFKDIHSKILQQFLKLYKPIGKKKLPKTPIKSIIILDNQTFNFKFVENLVFSNWWIRFCKINFPLRGKRILERITDCTKIKEARIFIKNGKFYCKLTYVKKVADLTDESNPVGLDVNVKRIATSNNKIYKILDYIHRKVEYKKNRGRKNILNFTKNYLHNLANEIIADLVFDGTKVLAIEDLRNLRNSFSKKKGTSKSKKLNYLINNAFPFSTFQNILKYKCSSLGIKIVKLSAHYTSKTCCKCGSLDTKRPTQQRFICKQCGLQIDADLNASRNIKHRYIGLNGLTVNLARGEDVPQAADFQSCGS